MINPKDETESKIKAAAREIFLERGKDGARMRAIAERAGVNKALVHYYFRTKEKLYVAILKDILKEVITKLMNIPADIPFRDFLREFISNHIDFLNQHKNLLNFILWELREGEYTFHDVVEDTIKNFEHMPREFFSERINEAIQKKEIRQVDPIHLIINLVSLDIFPFIASPVISSILGLSEDEMAAILNERKKEVFRIVWNDIKNE